MKQVLIVEDSRLSLDFIALALQSRTGIKVQQAANGKEALRILEQGPVDLILTDIIMPEMDGIELVQRIRERDEFIGIPIIIMTTAGSREDVTKAVTAGANEYIYKPVIADNLNPLLDKYLAEGPLVYKILMIAGPNLFSNSLREKLEKEPALELLETKDIREGICLLFLNSIKLILLDLDLAQEQGLDGTLILKRLQANKTFRVLPVLVLSAEEPASSALYGDKVIHYNKKDFTEHVFLEKLKGMISNTYNRTNS